MFTNFTLQKPQRKRISFFNRTMEADVIVTTNPFEAAYYLTNSATLIIEQDLPKPGIPTAITLKDLTKTVLKRRYQHFLDAGHIDEICRFVYHYQSVQDRLDSEETVCMEPFTIESPNEEPVIFKGRIMMADVVKTTSVLEAAYYLTGAENAYIMISCHRDLDDPESLPVIELQDINKIYFVNRHQHFQAIGTYEELYRFIDHYQCVQDRMSCKEVQQ